MAKIISTSKEALNLREATRHVMVDFNQMKTFAEDPLIMVEGDRITLTDHEGRRYIDGLSGVFAVSLGHGNDEIIDAIAAQHRRLSFSSPIMTTTDRALELATELIRLTGGRYDVVKQLYSGSEATEAALKMARQYHRQSGRPGATRRSPSTAPTTARRWAPSRATGWPQLRDPVRAIPPRRPPRAPADPGVVPRLRRLLHARVPRADPRRDRARRRTHGRGDHRRAGDADRRRARALAEYLRGLRALCDETGVLLVFDEIVTGFGRLGTWFAAEQADVWPDILCVGKGLTSGYAPLSAVLLTPRGRQCVLG